jgi:hypothetical protein
MAMTPGAHAIVGTGAESTGSTGPVPVRMVDVVDIEGIEGTEHSEHSERTEHPEHPEHAGESVRIGCTESVGVNRRQGKRAGRTARVGSSAYTGPMA